MDNLALGQRIQAHRVAAGLSLRELSTRVPVSAQALSQYEHGRTRPRSEILEVIADVLGTRVEQLLRPPDEEWLGAAQIRQISIGKRKTLRKAQGSLLAMTERSLALEQRLGGGFPSPSLPVMEEIRPIRDPADAEDLAQEVRRRWGLGTGPLPKLVSLMEARGVRVFELLQDEDVAEFQACAASVWFPGASWPEMPVILVNGALSGEQKRFALCHELAHMIFPQPLSACITDRGPGGKRETGSRVRCSCQPQPYGISSVENGGHCLGTSWGRFKGNSGSAVIGLRVAAGKRGIIARDTHRELLDQYGRDEWEESPGEEETSTRLRRLAVRAITEGVATPEEAAALLGIQQEEFDTLLGSSESGIEWGLGPRPL